METKAQFTGKREDSILSQYDTVSTSSEGKYSHCTHKSLYEYSPHIHRHHKRAKSLKSSLRKANIDFPDLNASPYAFPPLSPLPEPVEEDASEDSYVCLFVDLKANLNRKEAERNFIIGVTMNT